MKTVMLMLFLIPTMLSAQVAPRMSVMANLQQRTMSFLLSWIEREQVDSTTVNVYISGDTIPSFTKRVVSPETLTVTLPTDTSTYRFELKSYRRGLTSNPAEAQFYFDADKYYVPSGLSVYPKTVTIDSTSTSRQVQFCTFIRFADNTMVMRDRDLVIPKCVEYYNTIPVEQRSVGGAKQRVANKMCLQWTTTGGTIENEVCS